MASQPIVITREDIPLFWLKGNSKISVTIPQLSQGQLARNTRQLIQVDFGAAGDEQFEFGRNASLRVAVKAGARFGLRVIWDASNPDDQSLLSRLGLADYLENHPDEVMLYLDSGFDGEAILGGAFQYSALTGSVTLEAGADVTYQYLCAQKSDQNAGELLKNYFQGIRLPANVTEVPAPGEVISFEYGGRLNVGAEIGLGYELTGSPSFDLGRLRLSERYKLAVLSSLQFRAGIAGRYTVDVRAAPADVGEGWARVTVRKKRTSGLSIAADVSAGFDGQLEGLPGTKDEFLEAVLGVRAKNWLNLMREVRDWSDIGTPEGGFGLLKQKLDDLAKDFIGEWTGKAFDELEQSAEFTKFLNGVKTVVDSYDSLDESAINLFDAYFDRLNVLQAKVEEILDSTFSLDRLKGQVDPDLWAVINQFTGGDPLGFVFRAAGLPDIRKKAKDTLTLIQSTAHEEIRSLIATAKQSFGLETFFGTLRKVDTFQELRELADQKTGHFVERLTGLALTELSKSDLKKVFDRVHNTLVTADSFGDRLYGKLLEAATHSFSFKLHAEYNRTRDREALVDVCINLAHEDGKTLMREAGRGNFVPVLSAASAGLVRINNAVLTSQIKRESRFNINIEGWHLNWNYNGFDRVIVEVEQRVVEAGNGGIIVYSQLEFQKEKERILKTKRETERVYTNFMLRLLGESGGTAGSGPARFSERDRMYLIDALTGMAATYRILLEDERTTPEELKYYLDFASEFGLNRVGATFDTLQAVLPSFQKNGERDFGLVIADYNVRYNEEALRKLLDVRFDEKAEALVRCVMREIVLASYERSKNVNQPGIGWAYWSEQAHAVWRDQGANFTNVSSREFQVGASPFQGVAAPSMVRLDKMQLFVLDTLIRIEERMVNGLRMLYDELRKTGGLSPSRLEKAADEIGKALTNFDRMDDQDNTVFAVFDRLVAAVDNSPGVRASSLELTSEVEVAGTPQRVQKIFTSDMDAAEPIEAPRTAAAGGVLA